MKKTLAIALLGVTAIAVSACGGRLGQVEGMDSKGSAFQQALFADYIVLSKSEYGEGDYKDSDRFADKASEAVTGPAPAPYDPANWNIPANRAPVLAGSHARLVAALLPATMEKRPQHFRARKQVLTAGSRNRKKTSSPIISPPVRKLSLPRWPTSMRP